MSSFFKTLDNEKDVVSTRTLLHEAIPLTGTIVSGTYGVANIKDFAHGMFQSVYDYPFLSSSANHIFDITLGYASDSALVNTSNTQNSKKKNEDFDQFFVKIYIRANLMSCSNAFDLGFS